MKKRLFLLLSGLLVIFIVFSGCLQQLPNDNDGTSSTTSVILDGIAKAKYDFLTIGATNLEITGKVLATDGRNVIVHDATSGILIYDSNFANSTGAAVGDLITLNATFVYYYNVIEGKYNTVSYVSTDTSSEELKPVKLDITLDPDWLTDADKEGNLTKTSGDATSLSLWLFRYVTVEGTITLSEGNYAAVEYETKDGTSCIKFTSWNSALNYDDIKANIGTTVAATGILTANFDKWQLLIWDSNNIEY